MSIDQSLRSSATLSRHRNVLSRAERVVRLQELERWGEGMEALGLPKVGNRKPKTGGKKKAKGGEEEAAAK
ncbi:MAG: small basic protein [Phycisphaerales bacterium]|nr:small basic protein [Phycisphaerales bacterium]